MTSALGISLSGLEAARRMIETTSHNIMNMTNPDYCRQETFLATQPAEQSGRNYFGQGVKVVATKRVVDQVLVDNVCETTSEKVYWNTQQDYAGRISNLLGDHESSLNTSVGSFFNAVNRLGTQAPGVDQSNILLPQVMMEATNLVTSINRTSQEFDLLHENISFDLDASVRELNGLLENIAKLNGQIKLYQASAQGGIPNDLKDQRDKELRELSKLVEIGTLERSDATVDVYLKQGHTVVSGTTASNFSTQRNINEPRNAQIILTNDLGKSNVMDAVFTGGKIGSLLDFQNDSLNQTEADVNKFVIQFSLAMNAQHRLGMDSNGFMGQDLFTDFNQLPFQLERAMANSGVLGNAVFNVAIDVPNRPTSNPYTVNSTASALMNTGTMSTIGTWQLSLNGINIPVPTAANDTISPATDAASSAIALANVINSAASGVGISASANINVVNLGTYTFGAGGLAGAGNFVINGTSIDSLGASASDIVTDINSQKDITKVRAELDPNNNIILIADDGRNIQIDANGVGAGLGTFSYFNTTVANSQVARASITIKSVADDLVVGGTNPAIVGLNATTIPVINTPMTNSDYTLSYDGTNYMLLRLTDNAMVYKGATLPTNSIDGFTLSLASGAMNINDSFTIRPTLYAMHNMKLMAPTIKQLAFAAPLKAEKSGANAGNVEIKLDSVLDTSGVPGPIGGKYGNAFYAANSTNPKMSPPIQIKFFNDENEQPTLYRIYDMTTGVPVQIGPERNYNAGVVNNIFPLSGLQDANNAPYTWDPGYRISLSGNPAAGDTFNVGLNDGKSNYANAREFVKIQKENIVDDNATTFQGFYAQLVSTVGINNQNCKLLSKNADTTFKIAEDKMQSFSGVSMDEECTKLMNQQQLYFAAGQVIATVKRMMDELLNAFR